MKNIWQACNNQLLHQTERIHELLQGLIEVEDALTAQFAVGLHRLPDGELSIMFTTLLTFAECW